MINIGDNVDFLPIEIKNENRAICYGAIAEDCYTPFDIEKHITISSDCELSMAKYIFVVYKRFILYTPDGPLVKWRRIL